MADEVDLAHVEARVRALESLVGALLGEAHAANPLYLQELQNDLAVREPNAAFPEHRWAWDAEQMLLGSAWRPSARDRR